MQMKPACLPEVALFIGAIHSHNQPESNLTEFVEAGKIPQGGAHIRGDRAARPA